MGVPKRHHGSRSSWGGNCTQKRSEQEAACALAKDYQIRRIGQAINVEANVVWGSAVQIMCTLQHTCKTACSQ